MIITQLKKRLAENRKVSKPTALKLLTALVVGVILFAGAVAAKEGLITINLAGNRFLVPQDDALPASSPSGNPLPIPTDSTSPTLKPMYTDPDPVINCGPGQNSKQYIKDRSSNCKNYVDCGFNNNTWTLMLKTECDKKHAEENSKSNSNITNTYSSPSNTSNKAAIYITSLKSTLYCNPQNFEVIKQLDSASIQENQKALNLYADCIKGAYKSQPVCEANCNSQADYSACLSNCSSQSQQLASGCNSVDYYYQVNSLNKQILDFCNK